MKKHLKISLGNEKQTANEFIETWNKAKKEKISELSIETLYYEDPKTLLKILTPCRFNILQELYTQGKISIRYLSKCLNRDYKNVYSDVHELLSAGIILKDNNGNISVPWISIITEFPLHIESCKNKKRKYA